MAHLAMSRLVSMALRDDDPEKVIERLAVKNFDARQIVYDIIDLDTERRRLQTESDALLSDLKKMSSKIGQFMKEGNKEAAA